MFSNNHAKFHAFISKVNNSALFWSLVARLGMYGWYEFLEANDQRGFHWTLCHVGIMKKKFRDSLARPFLSGLLCRVDKYLKAVCKDDVICNYSVVMLHDPQNQCPLSRIHRCGVTFANFYPLQTCTHICGIVATVVEAIA